MTVTSTPSEIAYAGDGVSTVFTIPFVFDTSADLEVIETDSSGDPAVVTTGFSIAGGGGATGTLTRSVALPVGTTLTILDDPELTQPVDYATNDAFPAETHEGALDRTVRQVKRLHERVNRSLRVEDGDLADGDDLLLPIVGSRQGKFLAFDANGEPAMSSGTGNDTALRTDLASAAVGVDGSRLVGFRRTETGSTGRSLFDVLATMSLVNVKDFGAVGDGAADDTQAFLDALAVGDAYAPFGTYKITQRLPLRKFGIVGQGTSTDGNADERTTLLFYNQTDTTLASIYTDYANWNQRALPLIGFTARASSWNGVTGAVGDGIDITVRVRCFDVTVENFKGHGVFLHNTATDGEAPYGSYFENLVATFNGKHGIVIGTGANTVTFVNPQAKWNGAPSYGVAPSVAGNYDGFHLDYNGDGNPGAAYFSYLTEQVTVIAGNCSYNSRYGWNLDEFASSWLSPGYGEGNLVAQARVGNCFNCAIFFQALADNTGGLLNQQSFSPYFYRNSIYIGGKRVHPANVYDFIANPAAEDESSGTIQNAPSRQIFLSRSNDGTHSIYVKQNETPTDVAANLATETIATLRGAGTYAIGIGSGSRHLEVRSGKIILPDIYYQKLTTGWNTGDEVARSVGTAAPVAGTWKRGDIVWNSQPSAAGPPGWMCVTAGTPGTWKAMANLAA